MATSPGEPEDILRPILNTSKKYYIAFGIAAAVALLWSAVYGWQLEEGLIVTNLADWGSGGGSPWGLYIGAFIWWVGIAHGGIILSAAVRLFGMKRYQPVARMAELLTIGALSMAGLYIVVHTGRPDRLVLSVIPAYPWTVRTSPLAWDITVITLYFVLTATYLGLTIRYDIYHLREKLPDYLSPFYSIVTIGYSEDEEAVIERMVWWLALGIIVLAPLLLHGGVIPWLFSLVPSMPGWQGGVQGPMFLMVALTSAISGVIILSYACRVAYDWEHILTDKMFLGLSKWLGVFSVLFLWFQLQTIINGLFAAGPAKETFTVAKVTKPQYILAMGAVLIVLTYIIGSWIKTDLIFSPLRSVGLAFLMLFATLTEKVLFVFEGLLHPYFTLYEAVPGHYTPSLIELSSLAGTLAMCTIFFLTVIKLFPVVELHAIEHHDDHEEGGETEVTT